MFALMFLFISCVILGHLLLCVSFFIFKKGEYGFLLYLSHFLGGDGIQMINKEIMVFLCY